jgi:hypothetical protein
MSAPRAVLGVAGLGLMAYSAYGLVVDTGVPGRQALVAAALIIGHEAIIMPTVIIIGLVAVRIVPRWARSAAQVALVVTLALIIISIPLLAFAGTFPDLPSLLPRDYWRGLLIAVGATWLLAAAVALTKRGRARRSDAGTAG